MMSELKHLQPAQYASWLKKADDPLAGVAPDIRRAAQPWIDASKSQAPTAEPRYTMAEQLTQLTEAKAGWDSCISDLKKAADICSQIETENAALKREVAMWRSEHDPCPFSLENETLRAENERLEKQIKRFLEPVSDEEWLGLCSGDHVQFADVQRHEIDRFIADRLEPKGENDGN